MKRAHILLLGVAISALAAMPASANTITWTDWTQATVSDTAGSASGTMGSVNVSYTGQVFSQTVTDGSFTSFAPATTFQGGVVDNAPNTGDIIALTGGVPGVAPQVNTITFDSVVTNPIIAIWSLGQGGINAEFDFNATPTLQGGGATSQYGGQSITVLGDNVYGVEGNGIVEFVGDFTSISWTNPVYENWYGFTVGQAGAVPEPASLALLGAGLAGLGAIRRRKAKKA